MLNTELSLHHPRPVACTDLPMMNDLVMRRQGSRDMKVEKLVYN